MFYSSKVQKRIKSVLGLEPVPAFSLADTVEVLAHNDDFLLAIVDLMLPDSSKGEVVDLAQSRNIPVIILTSSFEAGLRDGITAKKNVVDYFLKNEPGALTAITDLIARLQRNKDVKVLIAEDSATQRLQLKRLLGRQNYEVIEAVNGEEALKLMEEQGDVQLVLTDYNMPVMDGFELVRRLREKWDKDSLAIIGLSAEGNALLSAKFLKTGANDFLSKPFVVEELVARVTQNVEILEMVKALKELAVRDSLTKLYNRRYFFDVFEKKFAEARAKGIPLSLGMLDLDFFKNINDTYGHSAGDEVLKSVSRTLLENTRGSDIVARLGGEEFCIVTPETDKDGAMMLFEKIRSRIESGEIACEGKNIKVTASIGVASGDFETSVDMLKRVDEMLYAAKSAGRNVVVFER